MVRLFTEERKAKQGKVRESRVMLWPLDLKYLLNIHMEMSSRQVDTKKLQKEHIKQPKCSPKFPVNRGLNFTSPCFCLPYLTLTKLELDGVYGETLQRIRKSLNIWNYYHYHFPSGIYLAHTVLKWLHCRSFRK